MNGGSRRFWRVVLIAGAALFVACLLPVLDVELTGSIGGGDAQQTFDFHRKLNLAWGALPLSLAYPAGALGLTAIAVLVLKRPRVPERPLLVAVLVLSAAGAIHFASLFQYGQEPFNPLIPHRSGHGCELQPERVPDLRCGGAFLSPAIDDFLLDTRLAHPDLDDLRGFTLRPAVGAWLFQLVALGLAYAAAFRLLREPLRRLRHSPWALAGVLVALLAVEFLVGFLGALIAIAENCYDEGRLACSELAERIVPVVWWGLMPFILALAGMLLIRVVERVRVGRRHYS